MKRNIRLLAVFMVVASVFVVGGIFLYLNFKTAPAPPKIVLEESGERVEESHYVEEDQSEYDGTPKTGFERALGTLEKPNEDVEGEELEFVRKTLTRLMTAVSETDETLITPKREDSSLLSNTADLKTLKSYILDGYSYSVDDVSVYQSDHDNVLQFIFVLKSPEEKDVAITGNYQKEVEQIQIGVFKK